MEKVTNETFDKQEPEYFYRVSQEVTKFGQDKDKSDPLEEIEDFKGEDLLEQKKRAYKCYVERCNRLEGGELQCILPCVSPSDFMAGQHFACSIMLSLIEYYNEDVYEEYYLLGVSEGDTQDALYKETAILKEKGQLVHA